MATDKNNRREIAASAVNDLPEDASTYDILLAVHNRLNLDDTLDVAASIVESDNKMPHPTPWSRIADSLACIIPLLFIPLMFLAMPLLFTLGERIMPRPTRTVDEGTIKSLTMHDGTETAGLLGSNCRVLSSHLIIESTDGNTKLIPSESYQLVELDSQR